MWCLTSAACCWMCRVLDDNYVTSVDSVNGIDSITAL
jgi:hypothetical protein